ncbi:MAG: hypothetical protein KJZ62_06045 [Fimbriimonadaceae bacterium]|nr:hypothetical protein [Fimbriimonadaceae bacterium]MCL4284645.1 hypothetical protein [Fimbriimonadaceae bacterium]QOJ11658.1 MAG: hypothetical protein HRU74_06155 [Chthonomonadaceae bacterium]
MKTKRWRWLAGMMALFAMAAGAQDSATLLRVAKKGDVLQFALKVKIEAPGASVVFTAVNTERVLEVDEKDVITVESTQSDVRLLLNGQALPTNEDNAVVVSRVKATGEQLEVRSATRSPDDSRRGNMTALILPGTPLKVGDRWSHDFKADPKTGQREAKSEYEVLERTNLGSAQTMVVGYKFAEVGGDSPATATGKFWINVVDGTLVKLSADLKNAPIEQAGGAVDMTIDLSRIL